MTFQMYRSRLNLEKKNVYLVKFECLENQGQNSTRQSNFQNHFITITIY